ncbi:tetratricopeptide repeat protein, partial [Albidovulum sp.]
MRFRKILSATLLSVSLAALAGCDNSEQRAEKYYQSGLAYLAQGDVDRALVELRNVFRLNGQHVAARRTYAEIEHKRGNLRAAFAQYLRLVEQKPDDLDALQALAEIAIQGADFETGLRHARAGLALAPDNATFQALTAAAEYGVAVARNDVQGQLAAITKVRALRETFPDSLILRQVVIDDRIRAQDFTAALAELDAALKLAPDNRDLHAHKVSVLSALGDKDGVEAALKDMVARFPGAPEIPDSLVRWYVANDELDKAEAFLRGRIDASGPDDTDIFNLVRFVSLHRGVEAALAELDRFAQGATATTGIRAARAGYRFDLGQRDAAIAEMKAILASDVTPQEARRVKVGLARMLSATGQANAAQSYVEEVLAEDSGDVEALKLKASWLIAEDQIGDAIAVLRRALDSDPNDAQA